jgi:hypothetical protein
VTSEEHVARLKRMALPGIMNNTNVSIDWALERIAKLEAQNKQMRDALTQSIAAIQELLDFIQNKL